MAEYETVTSVLLYFPKSKSFSIRKLENENYNRKLHEEYSKSSSSGYRKLVKMQSHFDGEPRRGIIVQVGNGANNLRATEKFCMEMKQSRNKALEDLLQDVKLFNDGSQRQKFPPLSVGSIDATDIQSS